MNRVNPVFYELLPQLATLEGHLKTNLLGQDRVLSDLCALLRRSMIGCRFPNQPIASALLMGPTGVGKTESILLATEHLFGDADRKLVRFDMSEYMVQGSLERLIGNRFGERGVFGYHFDRSEGSGVILFDELEKAHPLVLDVLLQILSAARFSLASGEVLDLRGYVVAAATNIGSRALAVSRSIDSETITRRAMQSATEEMRPELLARFDLKLVFNKLGHDDLMAIADLHLRKCLAIINGNGHELRCEDGVLGHIHREGYSEEFGARPIRAAAMRVLGDLVDQEFLASGGRPVRGVIHYDRRSNRCFIKK